MQIFYVNLLKGRERVALDVGDGCTQTIRHLRKLIEQREEAIITDPRDARVRYGHLIHLQERQKRLFLGVFELEDGRCTLTDYGITEGSIVHVGAADKSFTLNVLLCSSSNAEEGDHHVDGTETGNNIDRKPLPPPRMITMKARSGETVGEVRRRIEEKEGAGAADRKTYCLLHEGAELYEEERTLAFYDVREGRQKVVVREGWSVYYRDFARKLRSVRGVRSNDSVESLVKKIEEQGGTNKKASKWFKFLYAASNPSGYNTRFYRFLDKDIASDTSGDYKKLLLAYLNNYRPETPQVNMQLAHADCMELYRASEGRLGTDETAIIIILSSRSSGMKRETSGNFLNALGNRKMFTFPSKVLYKLMKGMGTDDATWIRIVVTRAEIDMQYIKAEFVRKYHHCFDDMISSDTFGSCFF
ncbi:hypothetical protein L7F22_033826 [Adiantum nelumboides]|nr:hypothetical protein [Adiantum nelumboides]